MNFSLLIGERHCYYFITHFVKKQQLLLTRPKQKGESHLTSYFQLDQRLGILVPNLDKEWDQYNHDIQQEILAEWEKIRGQIPDRIKSLEASINKKQAELNVEANFLRSCQLNTEIAELASIINDLWIWYRTNQHISSAKMHQ